MKLNQLFITYICFILLAVLVGIVSARATYEEPVPTDAASSAIVGAGEAAQTEQTEQTAVVTTCYDMYFTEDDVRAVAKMLWGEARGCTTDNKIKCAWVVCNRVDDDRFPDTIIEVLEQPSQFFGYSEDFPVTDELYDIAFDVLTRWSYERQGVPVRRELGKSFVWFTGNGTENIFREEY